MEYFKSSTASRSMPSLKIGTPLPYSSGDMFSGFRVYVYPNPTIQPQEMIVVKRQLAIPGLAVGGNCRTVRVRAR